MWQLIQEILTQLYQSTFAIDGGNLSVGNTTARTGNWVALQVLENAVIASITIDGAVDTVISGVTSHAAGTVIYGRITSVQLTSGKVRLYGGRSINTSSK